MSFDSSSISLAASSVSLRQPQRQLVSIERELASFERQLVTAPASAYSEHQLTASFSHPSEPLQRFARALLSHCGEPLQHFARAVVSRYGRPLQHSAGALFSRWRRPLQRFAIALFFYATVVCCSIAFFSLQRTAVAQALERFLICLSRLLQHFKKVQGGPRAQKGAPLPLIQYQC